ncbi:LysR family transcriptional regulator [Streptomyces sp. NBC_01387]|uniref:LysR family transcriptional regulator n=1 Tax=unclassified Streptomyces TaxID=2593676 RepID=UPI002024CF75|nr:MULTISPECIES: LysR family transcriptional regulator [unclassified Streptomyces]MCX4554004.1 LysR family transcriptional regulator [Streptomyces sp. NBC_01500]WSC18909.1 LysR family transcriptional regulator [Streptomyces sp. NBC_01766]WSV52944.1 LysR family transcriptional regulator [Streptomyces sp. NBC_01014]
MELRDIEIFLTLAEELHFGRTADRLHVSQARVSQVIAKQERRIGARLFARSSRRVELTPIGAQLREDLSVGYQRILDGTRAATATARGATSTLTLGLHGAQAHECAHIIDLFRARHPEVDIRIQEIHFTDPFGPLRDGSVEVATSWLPVREPDLTVGPLVGSEPLILMVASDHPLTSRDEVGMEDLAEWCLPQSALPIPEYWQQVLVPTHTPGGRPIRRGPKVSTFQEVAAVVAAGEAICLVHGDAARYYQWPGLRYLRPYDVPTGSWVLIWPTAGETGLVRALARAAQDAGRRAG